MEGPFIEEKDVWFQHLSSFFSEDLSLSIDWIIQQQQQQQIIIIKILITATTTTTIIIIIIIIVLINNNELSTAARDGRLADVKSQLRIPTCHIDADNQFHWRVE